jgi:hypothetical protein
VEEKCLKSKILYKIELLLLKTIPMLMALCSVSNSILSYLDIEVVILNYIGGVSILPLIFLYLSSYVFRFCEYHRMFLHYLLLTDIINVYDYHIGFPLSNLEYLCLHMIVTAISLFIILYLYISRKNE